MPERRSASMNRIFPHQFKNRLLCLFIALIPLGSFAPNSRAQASASISGFITDQTGAVIPGAVITVKNLETGATRTTKSESNGNYIVLSLTSGQYDVAVTYPGFRAFRLEVHLSVGQEARLEVT